MEWNGRNLECCNKRPTITVHSGHQRNLQNSSFIARVMHDFQEQYTVSCDGVSVAIFLYNKTIILDLAFVVSAKINKVLVSVISLDLRFG